MSGITLKRRATTDIPVPPATKITIFIDDADGFPKYMTSDGAVHVFPPTTTEDVQDAIGAMLTDSSTIDFTYDDPGGTFTAIVKNASITVAMLAFDPATQTELDAAAALAISTAEAFAIQRVNHTGTQTASTVSDFTEAAQDAIGALLVDSATLDVTYNDAGNVESAAVLDSPTVGGFTPANLRDRATHTGTQLSGTVSDFTEAAQDAIGALLADSATLDVTYNDAGNVESAAVLDSPTVAGQTPVNLRDRATHTGTQLSTTVSDFTEAAQDAIGALLVDSATLDVTYNDAGNAESAAVLDSPTVAGQTPANLRDRATHTGTQLSGTISDFTEAAQDAIGALLADSATLDVTYNDAGNAESAAVLDSPTVAGQTPANLRDRATHTGTQLAATVSDFTEAAQDAAGSLLADSATLDVTYNDAGNAESAAVITTGLDLVVAGVPGTRGVMYGKDKKKLDSSCTDAVADLGCDPTGATNNTALIQAWHDTLPAAGGGSLFIPDNCFIALATAVTFTKADILVFSHNRRTSGFVLTSATANGFTCSGDNTQFEKLRFIAGTPTGTSTLRTSGFAVEFTSTGDSDGCRECDFIYMWSGVHLGGALQWVDECTFREYGANATNGACVLIDGPGDRYVRRMLTDSTVPSAGHAGIRVATTASLVIDSCNIIHAGICLDIAPANGILVPSVEVVNTFFDTSVVGLNMTSAGSFFRSKFTNCWFGSMSDSGIKFGPTGTGSVDGITFVNCEMVNNVGGTTVGMNITSALVGKVKFIGCSIAGWTTGVVLIAGANFYPIFEACVVGGYGGFGNNTTGFNIGAGTYKGLHIIGCDCIDNTTPVTLGALTIPNTVAAAKWKIKDNPGINPHGSVGAIAIPGTGVAQFNNTGFPITIIQRFTVVPTGLSINGVATVLPIATSVYAVHLEPGSSITTTGGTYTWTWVAN